MELIYLYVKECNNIKEQGFNFSGRFHCHYDPDKNELNITENKDYLHIFPDNINITAIVGKNGSGKSSLFEAIQSSINIYETSGLKDYYYFCFYSKQEDKIYLEIASYFKKSNDISKNEINIITDLKYSFVEYEPSTQVSDFRDSLFYYFYKYDFDRTKTHAIYIYNEKLITFTEPNKSDGKINLEIEYEKSLKKIIALTVHEFPENIDSKRFFIPKEIELIKESNRFLGKDHNLIDRYNTVAEEFIETQNIKYLLLLENILHFF